jgi:hypothetical protein
MSLYLQKSLGCILQLLIAVKFPSSLILSTVMMEAILSTETSVLLRTTRHGILEDGILHNHRSEHITS